MLILPVEEFYPHYNSYTQQHVLLVMVSHLTIQAKKLW
jgi:hypothetical protein